MDQRNQPTLTAPTVPITLLGQREPRIPTAGKIRAGIKVLTKKAASNPQVKALYDDGIVNKATFEEIERKILEAFPGIEKPLVPKNVAWFTVRPNDFPNPTLADQILSLYGEDRGDGVRRLYRFPVMFPADRWQAVMPHELACWSRSEKRYWSEYGPDGHTRHCKMHAPARIDAHIRPHRTMRMFSIPGIRPRILLHSEQHVVVASRRDRIAIARSGASIEDIYSIQGTADWSSPSPAKCRSGIIWSSSTKGSLSA